MPIRYKKQMVHVLLYGLPMCGFTTNVPVRWPANHRWIGATEDHADVNCKGCMEAVRKLKASKKNDN